MDSLLLLCRVDALLVCGSGMFMCLGVFAPARIVTMLAYDSGEELLLGTRGSRRVGGVGVLVSTHLAMNIDSYESLTNRVGSRRLNDVALYQLRLFEQVYTFYKVIAGDFGERSGHEVRRKNLTSEPTAWSGTSKKPLAPPWTWKSPGGQLCNEIDHKSSRVPHGIGPPPPSCEISLFASREKAVTFKKRRLWEDTVMYNVIDECDFLHHLRGSYKKGKSFKTNKRHKIQDRIKRRQRRTLQALCRFAAPLHARRLPIGRYLASLHNDGRH
ncbi:unnamed protein product [Heligmosomoides polygyrus]|uniref:Uncharacterized protein n=1 Tax=Heligmosomoides polygyrus TaxID=6339 RepID=A0A183F497_HELPZ|nr:unnamed protein product [Heligmosomoides polygyrus]